MDKPTPEQIKQARKQAKLSQDNAAALVHATRKAWLRWEKKAEENEAREMPLASWELFLLKTGQHPALALMTD
ncbi:helix-turn-helix transcriptional regulator [Magnetococcus sp. PR-3]|uniref:helix-turn-helix transcriptional regulator n=1 Tax=Magnetococcus sp. PR-3 TaxID=3120355 RepID=UPI002FCE22EA